LPKIHRIISAGNSCAVTLSQDELDHMQTDKGYHVIITKAANERLIIRREYKFTNPEGESNLA